MATLKIVLSVLFIIVSLVITIVILFRRVSQQDLALSPELLIHIGARTRDVQRKDVWLKRPLYVLFFSLLFQLL